MGTKLNWDKSGKRTLSLKRGVEFLTPDDVRLSHSARPPVSTAHNKRKKLLKAKKKAIGEKYRRWQSSSVPQKLESEIMALKVDKAKYEISIKKLKEQLQSSEKRVASIDLTITQKQKEIQTLKRNEKKS